MTIKITGIELTPLFVPFKDNIKNILQTSERGVGMAIKVDEAWLGGEFVICRLICDDGTIGTSEVFVWLPETGASSDQIITVIKRALHPYIINESPFNIDKMLHKMDNNVARNEVAKGLIDMACFDLMGKVLQQPIYNLIGGKTVDRIPLTALIPLADIETIGLLAKAFLKMGFKSFRCKLGRGLNDDIAISELVRNIIGPHSHLRVDYNQAYTPNQAVQAIKSIEKYIIDFVEQPTRATDFIGLAYVQNHVQTPIMVHEGFFSLQDFVTLIKLNAVRVLGINSERPGGIYKAIKAVSIAEQLGLGVVIHNQPLGLATSMHIHLATAKYSALTHATELFGNFMYEDDLIKKPLEYSKGYVNVPLGPGWGVELDEDALQKYATSPPTIIGKIP